MDLEIGFKIIPKIFTCWNNREEFFNVFWYMQKILLYFTQDSAICYWESVVGQERFD